MYFMGLVILLEITGATASEPYSNEPGSHGALRVFYFPNFPRTMITVFQCITGGVMWGETSRATEYISEYIIVIWLGFICFTVLAVLNSVTGIFVDKAMSTAVAEAISDED